ncbi:ComEC/Rec2 family competence protein [Candidatus Falkowbacteria bacterium]|nr:ComEC/Rec2 family competence protein [Candidatus Falkowbacteria bacterium]
MNIQNFKKSDKIFLVSAAFATGIILASINFLLATTCWFVIWFIIIVLRRRADLAIIILIFSLGIFYVLIRSPSVSDADISFYADRPVVFIGLILDEPVVSGGLQKLVVEASPPSHGYGEASPPSHGYGEASPPLSDYGVASVASGKILLTLKSQPEYKYGDQLLVDCKQVSALTSGQYLNDNVFVSCDFPTARLVAVGRGNFIKSGLLKVKNAFIDKLNLTLQEPHASLLAGILVGARDNIPKNLADDFQRAGISHIVAMSGYNITVVSAMIMNMLVFYFIRRQRAFWFAAAGICCFIMLAGMSASVVRAGIMGVIILLAKQLGQIAKIKNILTITLLIMLLLEPNVWRDVGFQLSFLSTIGLIYLAPKIYKYFSWVPEFVGTRDNVCSSFSAIIMTLPVTIYYFHKFSVVAIAANFLILPTIPLIMLIGFIQLILAFIWLPVAKIVGIGTFILLDYVIRTAHVYASFSWSIFSRCLIIL